MDIKPVIIYAEQDAPRLRYIASLILGDILGLAWDVTTDKRKLGKHPVINYSDETITGSFKISPSTILFEKGVEPREITVSEWKSLPLFFEGKPGSDFPFDIFAASFYLVTRYEEYLEFTPDKHGRFRASDSLAFKNGFLGIPVIDLWTKEMSKAMLKKLPMLTYRRNEFRSLITIDSDEAFENTGSGLFRSISDIFREKKNKKSSTADGDRRNGNEKDPYDVFGYITEKLSPVVNDSLFFFPVGDNSEFDKNPSWKNDKYRSLIKSISRKFPTGLHPSFKAAVKPAMLIAEHDRLGLITEKIIELNRFHFCRLFFPSSYRTLLAAGITFDYSMGYPEEPGFRAGIARPFNFYDLTDDLHTKLRIFPFQVMDQTLFEYKQLNCEEAKETINKLINETKKAGGLFVSIWHNTSLLESPDFKVKRELFESVVKKINV